MDQSNAIYKRRSNWRSQLIIMNNTTQATELTTDNQASESTLAPKFVQIPHELIRDRKLGRSDLVVYGIVQWFTKLRQKKCFASNETIADIAGIAISNARRSLRKLEDKGHIKCIYKDKTKRHRLEIALTVSLDDARKADDSQIGQSIVGQTGTTGLSLAPIQIASQDNLDYHRRTQRNIVIKRLLAFSWPGLVRSMRSTNLVLPISRSTAPWPTYSDATLSMRLE